MMVSADIKCYYCGHVSGTFVGDSSAPIKVNAFRPSDPNWTPRPGEPLRCRRCGGPVFLDEVRKLRRYEAPVERIGQEDEIPTKAIA